MGSERNVHVNSAGLFLMSWHVALNSNLFQNKQCSFVVLRKINLHTVPMAVYAVFTMKTVARVSFDTTRVGFTVLPHCFIFQMCSLSSNVQVLNVIKYEADGLRIWWRIRYSACFIIDSYLLLH